MKRLLFTLLTVLLATTTMRAATSYNFSVGGVEVTSDNYTNITGSNITGGTVVFTPSNNTVTLTNVTISRTGTNSRAVESNRSGLIVKFVGINSLSAKSASAVRFNQPGSIVVASGVTTITGGTEGGVYSNNVAVNVTGPGKLYVSSTGDKYAFEGKGSSSSSTLTFSNITANLYGIHGALYDWSNVTFNAGSNIKLCSTVGSSYPVAHNIGAMTFNGSEIIAWPSNAIYNSSSKAITINGNKVFNDVIVSDEYVTYINSTYFPDEAFRNHILALYPEGYLTKSDIAACTSMTLTGLSMKNITGIAYFTELTALYCYNNTQLAELNLNKNTKLQHILCFNNPLMSTMEIDQCADLKELNCSNTPITRIHLDDKSNLISLNCKDCKSLLYVNCVNCALNTLNISGCTSLVYLRCYGNTSLTAITGLADCTGITEMYCQSCALTNLSACNTMTGLIKLHCQKNNLTSLTLTNKTQLTEVNASYNPNMTTATITNNSALKSLYVNNCPALLTLSCPRNALTLLNVSQSTALKTLYCYENELTYINSLNGLTALEVLNCYGNQITTLVLTSLKSLTVLLCHSNKLTSLGLTTNTNLKTLDCSINQLTTLNASACTALRSLNCSANQFTEAGMTTLVNSLPTLTAASPGTLHVLNHAQNENNVFTTAHATTAHAKYWTPAEYISGSGWVEIKGETYETGDVNHDGKIDVSDVTALIAYILGNSPDVFFITEANVNGDTEGKIDVSDVTALIANILGN